MHLVAEIDHLRDFHLIDEVDTPSFRWGRKPRFSFVCFNSIILLIFPRSNCGSYQHSDCNAAINLLKLGESVVSSTALVDVPMVAVS